MRKREMLRDKKRMTKAEEEEAWVKKENEDDNGA